MKIYKVNLKGESTGTMEMSLSFWQRIFILFAKNPIKLSYKDSETKIENIGIK